MQMTTGRIVRSLSGFYEVQTEDAVLSARQLPMWMHW